MYYLNHPDFRGVLLSRVALSELAATFYTTIPIPLLNGMTLENAMISRNFAVYIGILIK